MSPSVPAPAAHALAQTLLSEWEHRTRAAFPPPYLAARSLTLARFAALCELLLTASDVIIDADDARTTLASATSFGVATAAASGPDRAAQLVAAIQFHHHGPAPTGPASTILLGVTSRFDATLDMDELTFITEYVQNALGADAEIIFGHSQYDDASAPELRVYLLVGYGAPAPVVFVKPVILPNPPPDASGRDAVFAEAAHLLVRHQKASGSLLQRELKLGYNRTCRILEQLQQAGIIGASAAGQLAAVLITDEAQLTQHLSKLPDYQ